MTTAEIQRFWREFADEQNMTGEAIQEGESLIADDPQYWECHSMWSLVENLTVDAWD